MILSGCEKQAVYENPHAPVISSVYPERGNAGSSVYIYGSNFSPAVNDNVVWIGTMKIPVYKSDSSSLEAVIPQGLKSGYIKVDVRGKSTTGPYFSYIPTINVGSFAGSGLIGFQDGSLFEARFNTPRALAIDNMGNIYVADQMNHAVRKISTEGNVTTVAGDGTAGFSDGQGDQARFNQPVALAVSSEGTMYVADFGNNAIRKITPDRMVTTLAGNTLAGFADGTGSAARFSGPAGIVVTDEGDLLVSDFLNNVIRRITPQGVVSTWAGTGTAGTNDGTRQTCQFTLPAGLCQDAAGNIYVAGLGAFRVRKISSSGTVSTLAGSTQGYADGQGSSAMFNTPFSTAADNDSNVFVADGFNNVIREIDPAGNVTTLAGDSIAGYMDGSAENARFNGPVGLLYDTLAGKLYVTEWYNHRVRKITIR